MRRLIEEFHTSERRVCGLMEIPRMSYRYQSRRDESALRERLLDMLAAARRSDTIEELDRMQTEADDILRDTLQCFEHGAISEGALTAFNIALDQFHNAVADRKALLNSIPQNLQRAAAQFRASGTM